jgi:hypothetical protein
MPKPENVVGKGFEKYPERINRKGRPPLLVGHVLKQLKKAGFQPVTNEEIKKTYTTMLGLSQNKLMEIGKDIKQPMLFRIIVKAILSNKGFENIEKILDRAHGRSVQEINQKIDLDTNKKINISIDGKSIDLSK